ncbi:hypothetical protein ACFOY4_04365 [Actinomadura syzygii]|uniref:Uncharacterized protein n=1 Tax=Actinomadura syzygii TaxID=1427538 RepID=A0A5D0TX57_9ACTN|nr:hypothetical protein [Actinomadura syzygii]TYC09936.1 hypothetical protein FXF65_33045 [Actinomadura syzygii]
MAKLNQIIAIEKGVKGRAQREVADVLRLLQKPVLLSGISRVYRPKDDEGETLPPESTKVQVKSEDALRDVSKTLTRLFDVVATKDWANREASADVVVDGRPILTGVPVTYLLFLEKQLNELHAVLDNLPVLDASESWSYDESQDVWRAAPVETSRTKKVPRAHVLYEATEKHPAQVETFTEDVIVGTWTKVAFSGALPARRLNELRDRVDRLLAAVKYAREEANTAEVDDRQVGDAVFAYLFA